jgi:hypothetical protein
MEEGVLLTHLYKKHSHGSSKAFFSSSKHMHVSTQPVGS